MKDVWILGGARTPFAAWASGRRGDGSPGGALKGLDPFDLGAAALRGALERSGIGGAQLTRVVFGNMYHVGPHACYGARYAAWRAQVPPEVPCVTASMACGSGLHAVIEGARAVAETGGPVAAGGADAVSLVRRDVFVPSFQDISCSAPIGRTVEDLAREFGVSREAADAFALSSHARAVSARVAGRLADEIVPAGAAAEDDAPRPRASLEDFREAEPLFGPGGVVTKANTHAIVDGGSALVLAPDALAKRGGIEPLGRFVAGAYAGTPPARMGYASVPAVRGVLAAAGWKAADVDLWEVNETFAAQVLIDMKELDLPAERVNVNGGALALGHPFAATGCRQVLGLLLELRRRGRRKGVASICVGGGQGVAVAVEAGAPSPGGADAP